MAPHLVAVVVEEAAAEDAALLDPAALGTCALLVGAFVDNVCSALYDVPLKSLSGVC